MRVDIDYGQAVEVAKSVFKGDYAALLEGTFAFESDEEYEGLKGAYEVVMRWYGVAQ